MPLTYYDLGFNNEEKKKNMPAIPTWQLALAFTVVLYAIRIYLSVVIIIYLFSYYSLIDSQIVRFSKYRIIISQVRI